MTRVETRRAHRRWLPLRGGLLAAILGAAALAVTGLIPGSSGRLSHAAAGWIGVGLILELAACTAYALLFVGVFSQGLYTIPRMRGAQIALGELGAFVVVPTGAGGPALRIWALLRGGMPFHTVMSRSVIHAVIFNLPYVLVALLLGAGVALGLGPGHAPLAVALAPLGLVIVVLLLAGGAVRLARTPSTEPRARWRRLGREAIQAVPDGLRQLPARLRQPSLMLAAVGYWAGDSGVLVAAFHAAHGSAPIGLIALAYMLGQLGNALPLPGGVGGVEPIVVGVLTASGVSLGLAVAAVILYRFVSLGIQAIVGAIAGATLAAALLSSPGSAARGLDPDP